MLAGAAYLVGATTVVLPPADTLLQLMPPRLGEVSWRFGAMGLLADTFAASLLGLLALYGVALFLAQPRMVRALSVLSALGAVLLVALLGLFALDALSMRAVAVSGAKRDFDVATVQASVKTVLGLLALVGLGIGGWRTSALALGKGRGAPRPGIVSSGGGPRTPGAG